MTIYRIIRIGGEQTGWAIECNEQIIRTHPSAAVLGAYLDAILAGANEFDASDIAKVIERRPRVSYEERMAAFTPTGRPAPSREPSLRFCGNDWHITDIGASLVGT